VRGVAPAASENAEFGSIGFALNAPNPDPGLTKLEVPEPNAPNPPEPNVPVLGSADFEDPPGTGEPARLDAADDAAELAGDAGAFPSRSDEGVSLAAVVLDASAGAGAGVGVVLAANPPNPL